MLERAMQSQTNLSVDLWSAGCGAHQPNERCSATSTMNTSTAKSSANGIVVQAALTNVSSTVETAHWTAETIALVWLETALRSPIQLSESLRSSINVVENLFQKKKKRNRKQSLTSADPVIMTLHLANLQPRGKERSKYGSETRRLVVKIYFLLELTITPKWSASGRWYTMSEIY